LWRQPAVLPLGAVALHAADFIALVQRHGIAFHEKHKGQLFCDRSAEDLIAMLLAECEAGGVSAGSPAASKNIAFLRHEADECGWQLSNRYRSGARAAARSAGGGHRRPVDPQDRRHRFRAPPGAAVRPAAGRARPGLVPLTFDGSLGALCQLAGLALPVQISTGTKKGRMAFDEDLLFTHRGLSGPAVLQISSYWQPGTPLGASTWRPASTCPGRAGAGQGALAQAGSPTSWPSWCPAAWPTPGCSGTPTGSAPSEARQGAGRLAERLARWELTPTGTEGYRKAEVTLGGVDTRACRSRPWSARRSRGCTSLARWST
jgi:predicted flavoprotein YhiN